MVGFCLPKSDIFVKLFFSLLPSYDYPIALIFEGNVEPGGGDQKTKIQEVTHAMELKVPIAKYLATIRISLNVPIWKTY